jgi:hypothetical protein
MESVFNNKDFVKLYPNLSSRAKDLFDMRLVCYRNLKSDIESRLDLNVPIERLENLGLVKSHRFHSLILSESRNYNRLFKDELFITNTLNKILSRFKIRNTDYLYRDYLPRILSSYTDTLLSYHNAHKKGINQLNKITLDPLIDNKDWFIYDDESLNFLAGSTFNDIEDTVRIKDGIIYFQDKLPYMILPNKDYKTFIINISVAHDVIEDVNT